MLEGQTKTNKKHPGVSIVNDARTGIRDTLKWRCPETNKRKTQRCKGARQTLRKR